MQFRGGSMVVTICHRMPQKARHAVFFVLKWLDTLNTKKTAQQPLKAVVLKINQYTNNYQLEQGCHCCFHHHCQLIRF